MKKFNKNQENNDRVQNTADEIIQQENNKLGAKYEAHENINYDIDEDDICEIDNMSLDEKRENK